MCDFSRWDLYGCLFRFAFPRRIDMLPAMNRIGSPILRTLRIVLLSLLCQNGPAQADAGQGQWILVTPATYRSALTPLVQQRQKEGFKVEILEISDVLSADDVRTRNGHPLQERLKSLARDNSGRTLVLLAGAQNSPDAGANFVPPLRGVTGRMSGQDTDYGYGLPGTDGAPELIVGRLPARSVEELQNMVRKTLEFENGRAPAPWQNRLSLLAGNPGGGALSEMFVQRGLDSHLAVLHPAWQIQTLFDVPSSRFYVPPARLAQAALELFAQGQLFALYFGHSSASGLWSGRTFLTCEDWARLDIKEGRGPLFTCGCWACRTGPRGRDGYGLAAMRNPSGPVAVLGASGESYGAAGQLAGEGLLGCLVTLPFPSRLADYWLAVQTGLARGKMDDATFKLMDLADGSGGKVPLKTQRLEHLEMWTLLGDPALRMPVVTFEIKMMAVENARPGHDLEIRGVLPKRLENAAIRVTLERPLDSTPHGLQPVPADTPESREVRDRVILANHALANSYGLAAAETKANGNKFTAHLEVPALLPSSTLVLRAAATKGEESGMGITLVMVDKSASGN